MENKFAKALTYRQFLKMCGLAVLGAGATQVSLPATPASAYQYNEDLIVMGKVGIGTTCPAVKLHVEGGSAYFRNSSADTDPQYGWFTNLSVWNTNNSNGTFSRIAFVDANDGLAAITVQKVGAYQGKLLFQTRVPGNYVTAMAVAHMGNIGIGTPDPLAKLDVRGGAIAIDYGQYIHVSPSDNWPSGTHRLIGVEWASGVGDVVNVYTPGSIRSAPLVTLVSNGNVGIGTTNPRSSLHLYGGAIRIGTRVVADDYGSYYA